MASDPTICLSNLYLDTVGHRDLLRVVAGPNLSEAELERQAIVFILKYVCFDTSLQRRIDSSDFATLRKLLRSADIIP